MSAEGDESCISPGIDSAVVEPNDRTFRRLRLPRRNVSAERDMNYVSASTRRNEIDGSLNVDPAVAEPNDLSCRRRSLPPAELAAEEICRGCLWLSTAAYHDVSPHSLDAGRLCRRAKRRLYKARPVDCAVSMQRTSDGVTRSRITPKT